jgi:multicomponent Na+:H+ antiporter subunit F
MIEAAARISLTVFAVAMFVALYRLVRGGIPDRAVALDLMTIIGVCIAGVLAVIYRQEWLLDVAVVLSLIGFVVTVAIARYVEARS